MLLNFNTFKISAVSDILSITPFILQPSPFPLCVKTYWWFLLWCDGAICLTIVVHPEPSLVFMALYVKSSRLLQIGPCLSLHSQALRITLFVHSLDYAAQSINLYLSLCACFTKFLKMAHNYSKTSVNRLINKKSICGTYSTTTYLTGTVIIYCCGWSTIMSGLCF